MIRTRKMGIVTIISIMVITVGLFLTLGVHSAYAADEVASGTCGADATWTLDSDGVLTISGSGAITDYSGGGGTSQSPFYAHKSEIESVVIDEGITHVGKYSFYYVPLKYVTLPDSLTSFGDYSFCECYNMESINIPDNVTTIGSNAFSYCSKLTSLSIPNGVTTIGDRAFMSCSYLESMTIPDSVTSIGSFVFQSCSRLTDVYISNSITKIPTGMFYSCGGLTQFTIPDWITRVGSSSFYGCKKLTTITIPYTVTTVEQSAFEGCEKLNKVYYTGVQSQWDKMTIGQNNTYLTNAQMVSIHEHAYDNGVITDPTCTEKGYTTYTCTRCGETKKDDYTDALNHAYDDGVITDPTCTEKGYTTYSCTRCDDSYKDDYVDALGHDYTGTEVTDPTCTEKGYTTHSCSRCDESYKDSYVDALGHTHSKPGVVTKPTTTTQGYTTYECDRCGQKYQDDYVDTLPFDKMEVTFSVYDHYRCEEVKVVVCNGKLKSVVSADPTIATCSYEYETWRDDQYIYIEPTCEKLGVTEIIATDENDAVHKIKVTVKSNFKLNKSSVTINQSYKDYYHYYDSDDVYLYGLPSCVICKRSPVDDSGNVILREDEFDGECPYNQVIYSDAVYENYGDYYNEGDGTIYIKSAVSKNTSVVKLRADEYGGGMWDIIPVSVGTATIECTDSFGQKTNLKVTVSKNFVNSYIKAKTSIGTVKYGSSYATGYTIKGASVTAVVAGKKYTAKANSSGKYSIKIPIKKIGTEIKYTFSYGGGQYTISKKVVKPGTTVAVPKVYRSTKKATITVKNVHKGDKVTIKVGKNTLNKTVKKDAKKVKYTIKLKKKCKEGNKISIAVKNKFKQSVASKSSKVYYASKIKKGMTKKQCKLVPGWEKPIDVYVSGNWTTWYYDKDGDGYSDNKYLEFYKGKLNGWHK